MPSAGSIYVDLMMNDSRFTEGTRRASATINSATASWRRSIVGVRAEFAGIGAAFTKLSGAISLGAALLYFTKVSDEVKLLYARIEQSTQSASEMSRAFEDLGRQAIDVGTKLRTGVDIFQRLSFSRNEIKATNEEMLAFVDTVQKLGAISGASPEALSAGLMQLGQGLSGGVLRAEEFNSILENVPAIANAISSEFGVSVGELRKLVLAGEVLSKDVMTAILRYQDEANEKFAKMPMTVARGFSSMTEGASIFAGELNRSAGITDGIGSGMKQIGVFLQENADKAKLLGNVLNDSYQGMETLIKSFGMAVQGPEQAGKLKEFLQSRAQKIDDTAAQRMADEYKRQYDEVSRQMAEALNAQKLQRQFDKNYKDIVVKIADSGTGSAKKTPAQKLYDDLYDKNRQSILGLDSATLKYNDTIGDLNKLLAGGRITQDEYSDAVKRVQDEFEKASEKSKVWAFDMEEAGKEASRSIQRSLADFLFDPADQGFRGMLKGFVDTLRRMQAEAASAQILNAMFGEGGIGSGGGFLGKIIGGFFSDGLGASSGSTSETVTLEPSKLPGFAVGIDTVPYDMAAIIHKDEAVLNKSDAAEWRAGKAGTTYYQIDARGADAGAVRRLEQALLAMAGPGVIEARVSNAQSRGGL